MLPRTAILLAAAVLALLVCEARSHEWYPRECCAGGDCYAISADEVEALPDGTWRIKATGEIFYGANAAQVHRVKFSPDGGFHRCSLNHDRKEPSICLFIPMPNGY
jgi:hypothetical protein